MDSRLLLFVCGLWFGSLAQAAPTYNAPSVRHADAGSAELAAGPGLVIVNGSVAPGARLAGQWAPVDRFALQGSLTGYFPTSPEVFALLGFRYALVDKPGFAFGPYTMFGYHHAGAPLDQQLRGRLGVALDTGGEVFRFDLSLALVGVVWQTHPDVKQPVGLMSVAETLFGSELGLSWRLHSTSVLRVGLLGSLPSVSYRFEQPAWFAEAMAASIGRVTLVQSTVGMRF